MRGACDASHGTRCTCSCAQAARKQSGSKDPRPREPVEPPSGRVHLLYHLCIRKVGDNRPPFEQSSEKPTGCEMGGRGKPLPQHSQLELDRPPVTHQHGSAAAAASSGVSAAVELNYQFQSNYPANAFHVRLAALVVRS